MTTNSHLMTQDANRKIANMVEGYWRERGVTGVRVRIDEILFEGRTAYVVRSNLVNGLPPRAAAVSRQRESVG